MAERSCPLSPLLFVLYLEPLAEAVMRREAVIGEASLKVSLYKDDVTLLLDGDRSVKRAMEVVQNFATGTRCLHKCGKIYN